MADCPRSTRILLWGGDSQPWGCPLYLMPDNLLVMKFGGTSVGSAERMKAACDLIAVEAARRPVLAVVSAMSKITDLLLDTTRHAEGGDQAGIDNNLRQLETRHLEAAASLIEPPDQVRVRE